VEMMRDPRRRLVESGDQLLDVVMGSLGRLQGMLKGHTPMARAYWDRMVDSDLYRPVDENTFSDFVKRHLQDDLVDRGVIVNREVEVYRPKSAGIGQRTDIHVDAVASTPQMAQLARVTVVIEAKGCWNDELGHAMATQLRDKYLREGSCTHGVYLVGWFNCDKWDPKDTRGGPDMTRDQAQHGLDTQAVELSGGGFVIGAMVLDLSLP